MSRSEPEMGGEDERDGSGSMPIRWPWPESRPLRVCLQLGAVSAIVLIAYIVLLPALPRRPWWAIWIVYILAILLGSAVTGIARRAQLMWRRDGGSSPRVWGYLVLAMALIWAIAALIVSALEPGWNETVARGRAVFNTRRPAMGVLVIVGVLGSLAVSVHGAIGCSRSAQRAWTEDQGWSPRVWAYLTIAFGLSWLALAVVGVTSYLLDF